MTPSAKAALFCVQNVSELNTALAVALIAGGSDEIRLGSGTYAMPVGYQNSVQNPYASSLTMTGGWNSDCSVQDLNPGNTIIDGLGSSASEWVLEATASVTIRNLTFVQTGGLHLRSVTCAPSGQSYRVSSLRMTDSVKSEFYSAALTFDSRCHTVRVENNLIYGSEEDGIVFWCWGSGTLRMVNNTVRDVGRFAFRGEVFTGDVCSGNPVGNDWLVNNVLGVVRLIGMNPRAYNNIYSVLSTSNGGGFFSGSANNLTVDPQLNSDYRPIEPGSPAINSGTGNVPGGLPGVDIEGGPRVVGGTVDRGAFESSVIPPGPFVLTVTNSASSGTGTLRDIIEQANASPGLNLIQFDIAGSCPRIITLAEPLPDIAESVIINGYSQNGASFNSFEHGNNSVLCIGLIASQLVDVPWALRVPSGSNAVLKVRGIGFGGYDNGGGLFGEAAIYLQDGSGHEIQGNQFGGPFHGTTLAVSSEHVRLMNSASQVLIGGTDAANRNTFSNASFAAIHVVGSVSGDHDIINNYIGTNPAGTEPVANFNGIRLTQSSDNQILDNLISGQTQDGIVIVGENAISNLIAGNRIGGRRAGIFLCGVSPLPPCPPIPTNRKGILIDSDASNNSIGVAGLNGAANLIRYSTQHGIRILSGTRNRILSNSMHLNGTVSSEIEIDLGNFGLDANDDDCSAAADLLANRGQNRPVIESASVNGQEVTINGSLTSCSNDGGFSSVYRLQFFANSSCDPGGTGPAQDFLGDYNVIVSAPDNTQATVAFTAALTIPEFITVAGRQITATATDLFGNTSELSACVPATADGLFADRFEQ